MKGFFGLNPTAVLLWCALALGGGLIWGSWRAAGFGLLIGICLSFLADISDHLIRFNNKYNRRF